jgi:phosphoribosyl-ATP pyrophosphohydrolase/phosphoribosyl-AMP cyclohydrolase
MEDSLAEIKFDERGLVPAVVQDARTGEVLTLAYMNAESLARTLATGETWFWSRSRAELWHKGATSGHTQRIVSVRVDCDADALVVAVEPRGPACHTGARSCFQRTLTDVLASVEGEAAGQEDASVAGVGAERADGEAANVAGETVVASETVGLTASALGARLETLYALVARRQAERPAGSYTTYLFEQGLDKILKKVGEEAAETIIAAKNEDAGALVAEAADLLYHLVVLFVARGLTLEQVGAELARRGGKSGRAEGES